MRLGITIVSAVAVICIAGAFVDTTNRLTLASEVAEFHSYEHRDGRKEAEADIASGSAKWKIYGLHHYYEVRSVILKEKLHLTLDWFAGCIVTGAIERYAREYNASVRDYVTSLYGEALVYSVLGESNPPNQALEPTTPAVTIPAAQEVAPAGVVAHL